MRKIELSGERREAFLEALRTFHRESFDEELTRYRAERLLEYFTQTLVPPIYNQAIQDARGFMLDRLDDLDVEFYEPEQL